MAVMSSAGLATPPKVALRLPANLAGGIYGTILATALVAGLSEGRASSARALVILLGTGAIVWAAHVYASLLANRLERQRRLSRAEVRCVAARDWPLFQSSVPLSIPLAIGWLGIFSRDTALTLATLVGMATLVAWGIGLARSEGRGSRWHRLRRDHERCGRALHHCAQGGHQVRARQIQTGGKRV